MTRLPSLGETLVLVVLIATVVLCSGLNRYPVWEPDEARHAEIGREMLAAPGWEGWVAPSLNGEPYRNKPALFYWLVAAAFALLGVTERAARLVPAASGLATVVAVSWWAAGRWGTRAGVVAGVVLVTALQFAVLGRFVSPDMTVTLWTTLGVLAVERFAERPGTSLVPAAVAAALGMLAKGLVAPVVIGSVGISYLAARRRLALLRPHRLAAAALVFLVLVLPWHLAVAVLDPGYLRQLYVSQHWQRVVDAEGSLHARSVLFYVPVLLAGFLPWSPLLPASLLGTLRRERRGAPELLCALWAGLVLLLFSLAQGKLAPYILPALPPLALLTARHLERVVWVGDAARERRLTRAGLWVCAGLLALAPLAIIGLAATTYDGVFVPLSLASLVMLPAAAGLALLLRRGHLGGAVLATAGTATGLLLLFFLVAAPRLGDLTSLRFLARAVAATPEQWAAPLVAYHLQAPAMSFYLGRPVLLLDQPRQLRALLAEHALVFVVTSPQHVPQLVASGPFVPWRVGPRRALFASQPPPPNLDSLDRPAS
jgi:4-amino-4-deoxy-L-arabinose transferase-like glycosyltransferase